MNLYGFVGNEPIRHLDFLGLAWKTSNCNVLSSRASASLYAGFGGQALISVTATRCDCCDNGNFIKGGYVDVAGSASISIGVGAGIELDLPIYGKVGYTVRGPQFTNSQSLSYVRSCGQSTYALTWTILSISGDLGGSFSISYNLMYGSVDYWLKYLGRVDMLISDSSTQLNGTYGWTSGGKCDFGTRWFRYGGVFSGYSSLETVNLVATY